jgi:cell division protein FtsI (penicillin-binding protein 3)
MKNKQKKNKDLDINQTSFYFEDYLEKNQKEKKKNFFIISQDRVYLLFFLFVSLIIIFSIKITLVSLKDPEILNLKNNYSKFTLLRRDIVDRNGILISRNVKSYHAAISPNLVKDKKNLIIKIRLNFPDLSIQQIEKKLDKGKYFYLKKRLDQNDKEKLRAFGEKGIIFEPFQLRIYTHANLYSHILGQVDYDNYGISGVENFFDRELVDKKLINSPLQLTLDSNIQHLIDEELNKALVTFKATGGGALLMDVNTGEVLSLVSLPNYNINQRANIIDKNYINKITKGVYELGSIFKTFTVALALEEKLVTPTTVVKNIPRKIKCSIYEISDIKQFPQNMSVEDILIRSSNVGASMLAKKIGADKYKKFFKDSRLLNVSKFELEEVGIPKPLKWNEKCTLETISYGHGIAVTPLQVTAVYSALANGGNLIKPTILKKKKYPIIKKLISTKTSSQINAILRKVVSSDHGTASLADEYGYNVGGKTGTSEGYENKKNNLNSFVSIFPSNNPKYALLIMLENPKPALDLTYNYRGNPTRVNRAEAGWNSVYVAGKIIKKIGPILAIKNKEFYKKYVAKKTN